MKRIGLTGNVASGKSEVARVWAEAGVPVVSADDLAREAVAPGTPGLDEVVAEFGRDLLDPDGTLDRPRLRQRILADPTARRRLEQILHPRIADLREQWLRERAREGVPLVVSEIPLLFETGLEGAFDVVVVVHAPASERLRRLVEDRGLARDEAERLMSAQGDPDEKRRRADHVLMNDGDLETLREEARELLERLGGPPSAPPLRIDLHLHTRASWDCVSDPEKVLERARRRGIGRIAITDHDRLPLALEMAERYPEAVIPGEEVRTAEGVDLIGLYLSDEIPRGTPALEVCGRIREQGGIVYLPHPYAPAKGGSGRWAEELAPHVDVVEVFNARLPRSAWNDAALELAGRTGRLHGAGSDAHTVGEVGNGWVEVPPHPNRAEALLEALTSARTGGHRSPLHVFLWSNLAKVWTKLGGPS